MFLYIIENMNIAVEQTEEWDNEQLVARYGDAVVRSHNIRFIGINYAQQ